MVVLPDHKNSHVYVLYQIHYRPAMANHKICSLSHNSILVISVQHYYLAYAGAANSSQEQCSCRKTLVTEELTDEYHPSVPSPLAILSIINNPLKLQSDHLPASLD